MTTETKTELKNQGSQISKIERFIYEILLDEHQEFDSYCNNHEIPDHVKSVVADSVHSNYHVLFDPRNIEQVKVVVGGSYYSFEFNTEAWLVASWGGDLVDEPIEDLFPRATKKWLEQAKRALQLIELTARHQREIIDLDALELSDMIRSGIAKLPFYKFMNQEIGKY